MISIENIRTILLGVVFVLILLYFFKKKQSKKLNWSLFYSFIWILFSLPIVNYICVEFNLWLFLEKNTLLKIPYDILFIWLFIWLLPFYIFKGKYFFILILIIFWLDIIAMPMLEKYHILKLNSNWLIGEVLLILFVFIPSYIWSKYFYENKFLEVRAIMQVLTMSLFLLVIIPFSVKIYETNSFQYHNFSSIYFQIIFIIAFPAFIAVIDLVEKGIGTPFPFDKTKNLVNTGVYAYIKNPIQWSFTVLFIPLAFYHQTYLLFLGSIISLAYTIGVSNPQEYIDMEERFGEKWVNYKKVVPSWYFLWEPKNFPSGTIYFKENCNQCEDIKRWFTSKKTKNLKIDFSKNYIGNDLLQVTYVNYLGQEFKSIKAISHALEHINLGYASLGWFMRFPIISFVLQAIINAFEFNEEKNSCKK